MKDYIAIYPPLEMGLDLHNQEQIKEFQMQIMHRFESFKKIEIRLNRNYTDDGIDYNINCWYDLDDEESVGQARAVENNLPIDRADNEIIKIGIIEQYMFSQF